MKKSYFATLFILSVISLFLFEDSLINEFSLSNFIQPFIFVSLPFALAYLMGWKKGFGLSMLISLVTLSVVWFTLGERDFWFRIYGMFFASFSIAYFLIGLIGSHFRKNNQP